MGCVPIFARNLFPEVLALVFFSFLSVSMAAASGGPAVEGIHQRPEIFVQAGHAAGITSVAFSPDGSYVLSGSFDKTAKLWETATGREIRTFSGHTDYVSSVAFSPDGRYALSGSQDKTLKLWETATGQEIRTFSGHTNYVSSVAFSPDGRYALSGSQDKTLKLWEVSTGREVRTFSGHTNPVSSVSFSPDGKYVISGSLDNTLKLWEVDTGREIRTFSGHTGWVNFVTFSPEGTYVLSGSSDKTIKLWETTTGNEVRTFSGREIFVFSAAFSPDGKYMISGSSDKTLNLREVATGKEIGIFSGHADDVLSVIFSPDGRYALSGSRDKTAKLWETATGREIRTFSSHTISVHSVAFSSDGQHVASGSDDKTIRLWDIAAGKEIRTLAGHTVDAPSVVFSPDGNDIVSGSWDKTIRLWDIATGKEIKKFGSQPSDVRSTNSSYGEYFTFMTALSVPDLSGCISSVAISPDGGYILSGGWDKFLTLWKTATGKKVRLISGHTGSVSSVAFSPDGRYGLSGSLDNTLKLWEIASGREIRTFSGHSSFVLSVAFSPDGRHVLSGSADGTVKLWEVASGRERRTFSGHKSSVLSVAFSPDGRYALSGSLDNTLKLWEIASGREIRTLSGHTSTIDSVAFSPDGRYAASGSHDNTVRLWDISTGSEIVTMVVFKDGEWISITPEGYYNSSQNGHRYLNIRQGNHVYGIDQFYDVFYRPDIVAAKIRGEDINGLVTLTIDDAINSPPPSVKFTVVPKDASTPRVNICYQVRDTGGGIGEVRLFHNGKLIQSDGYYRDLAKSDVEKNRLSALNGRTIYKDMRSITIKGNADLSPTTSKKKVGVFDGCKEIDTVTGENEVSAVAFNDSNTVQSFMKTINFTSWVKPEEPHFYMLVIGIDRYRDVSVNLKYASKDAADIQERTMNQSATLYKPHNVHSELILDNAASKANILGKIAELERVIKPNDIFLMFVAGHGVLLQNQYYMLTRDYDGTISNDDTISSNEIIEISKRIKSLSQLFIFDTCHAGGMDNIVSGLYDARMSVLAKKMGLHIYASANSKQAAMDGYKGNGLFTYTLLDGLNNKKEADRNNDGKISFAELGEYAKLMTMEISKKIVLSQTPLIINFGKDSFLYQLKRTVP